MGHQATVVSKVKTICHKSGGLPIRIYGIITGVEDHRVLVQSCNALQPEGNPQGLYPVRIPRRKLEDAKINIREGTAISYVAFTNDHGYPEYYDFRISLPYLAAGYLRTGAYGYHNDPQRGHG